MKHFRKVLSVMIAALITASTALPAYAAEIVPFSADGKIISVAHGGRTDIYPPYSLEAVQAAFECGADCVSVEIRRTADGEFILAPDDDLGSISLEGKGMSAQALPLSQIQLLHLTDRTNRLSDYTASDLSDVLCAAKAYDKTVIIDGAWQWREEVYKTICENDTEDCAIIRTDAPKNEISDFIAVTNAKCNIIGKHHGNILFTARSYITALSNAGCKIIFLGTKNSFGVIFRTGVLSAFARAGYTARAAMQTFDMKESGGRPDNESTWSDIIDRGYSVIETDQIADLTAYISKLENERASLSETLDRAKETETAFITLQSRNDIETAIDKAEYALTTLSSFNKLSLAKSNLNLAVNNMVFADSQVTANEGVLSVTPGKILAIIIATIAIIIVQMYFYYRQADKKLPAWLKNLLHK